MVEEIGIGIDVGSVSINTIVMDGDGRLLYEGYRRTNGLPFHTALSVLDDILGKFGNNKVAWFAATGSGGADLVDLVGGTSINEIVAQSRAVAEEIPSVRTVIEMGGEDSKLLLFDQEEGKSLLKDFSMNTLCAAGTGSFLDQQAVRLGVSIEKEFGEMALRCKNPPRIAGRCSVFAKSDMIHLQQVGTPVEDIVSGLCHALARNFKASIGQGKTFLKPIAFQGGVAANIGMVRAFENALELEFDELIIPEHHASMGALGALMMARESHTGQDFRGLDGLKKHVNKPYTPKSTQKPLGQFLTKKGTPESKIYQPRTISQEPIEAYLGIDVGSISTNLVVIDKENRVLAKRYLPTASRPIEAIGRGLDEIYKEIGDKIVIRGAGTTGSGRYMSGDIIGADVVRNEITAQATAAIDIDPDVDTVFEIGGQDSKYISIDKGAIVDFEMNKVCAAGTGSFLEEQAKRLHLDLKTEFAPVALKARHPVPLGDRCTVFMETDLVHHQQAGADKGDLLAGLAYSTVYNYLNRVVSDKRKGKRIFFQGGTAFNKSVVAAFNSVLGREITVPPHHEVTGAIGVAIIARKSQGNQPSKFKGFDLSRRKYELETFECHDCPNHCEIHCVKVQGEKPLYYGSRCGKYDVVRSEKKKSTLPDLFSERQKLLLSQLKQGNKEAIKGRVGIPLASIFYELFPFWCAFFQSLGFKVETTGTTNKMNINEGVAAVVSESCFPIKVAHGHMLQMFKKKPDFIFLPSIIDAPTPGYTKHDNSCFNCPYIQALPYTIDAALNFKQRDIKVFSPPLYMQSGFKRLKKDLCQNRDILKCSAGDIHRALEKAYQAQEVFLRALKKRGREILENMSSRHKTIVIVGRPYNTCDPGVNLDLPKKLIGMNVLPVPMDMLPLEEVSMDKNQNNMYWRYGEYILRAAQIIRDKRNLYGLYVTNFGCGPDSFLLKFFAKELGDKPFLQIEIDEHSADAGIITRCEAYLDTIASYNGAVPKKAVKGPVINISGQQKDTKLYIPQMCKHAYVIAMILRSEGYQAEVMDLPDEESLHWGRKFTTGKECYPALLTTGDMIRQAKRPDFDPDHSAFFMASANGPCRFGQYVTLQRNVLDELGLHNVPMVSLDQDTGFYSDFKGITLKSSKLIWQGVTAVDALERHLLRTRPYEKIPGQTESLYQEILEILKEKLREHGDVYSVMETHGRRFDDIATEGRGTKPLIGIVGEIYIRSNETGNGNLIKTIEAMDAEVAMPPISEWLNYVTLIRKWRNKQQGYYKNALKDLVVEKYMHGVEKRMMRLSRLHPEPFPIKLLRQAKPYLHHSFSGEAILSIGKTLEFIRDVGADGVINVMPFTCMPGTIVTAILKRIHDDYNGFPCISLAFTGQQSMNLRIRLEAFMYQARENQKKHSKINR